MFGIDANHSDHTLAVNDLALITHLFYGSTDFHLINLYSISAKTHQQLFVPVSNSAAVQVVWRQLNQHSITRKNPNKMLAHLP